MSCMVIKVCYGCKSLEKRGGLHPISGIRPVLAVFIITFTVLTDTHTGWEGLALYINHINGVPGLPRHLP